MTDNERQKKITTSFQRISKEERMQFVEREIIEMKENSNPITSSIVQKEKRLVGKPKKQQNVRLLSEQEIKKKAIENKRPSKCSKKRGEY
jgi:hypothetical protein